MPGPSICFVETKSSGRATFFDHFAKKDLNNSILRPIIIRRSPVIIIRNLIFLQIAATLIYFLLAFLADYGELYDNFGFSGAISFKVLRFIFILIAELLLLAFIFLRWFFWQIAIHPQMVVIERNIFLKKRATHPLQKGAIISLHQGLLGRLLFYGTLVISLGGSAKPIILDFIAEPEKYRKLIEDYQHQSSIKGLEKKSVEQLLQSRENENLEFKSSLRWDHKEKSLNRALEKATLKNVAAFLNSEGGYIVLGVGDSGEITGLENDLASLSRKDWDGFEAHFTNIFNSAIGSKYRHLINLYFHKSNGKDVCVLAIQPSNAPVYLKFDKDEYFYIRTGNTSNALPLSEVNNYIKSRWREI